VATPPAFDLRLDVGREAVLAGAEAVFCLVTADQALTAAGQCAPYLSPGALWFDGNSCAPETKARAAEVIHAAGGRYVDTAIMAPVHPRLHRTPILISGPHAAAGLAVMIALGMVARVVGDRVGQASSIKMLRSVMIKGMEALHAECFLAARKAGVEAEVIGSLIASNPEVDWPVQGGYNLERMMSHGLRRAAEMCEVVQTLHDLGLAGDLTSAVADWQERIGQMGLKGIEGDLWARCDLALARL
jgi:3-hydroxyisobutyrate dehydrogenase-like beta-hydroxyacid dehydrogenase